MHKFLILLLSLVFISPVVFAGNKFCFDPEKVPGDTISLKLSNLSKSVAQDDGKKGVNCFFNAHNVPNKLSIVAFKEKKGKCTSEFRTCKDGTLSGSYSYDECEETGASGKKSSSSSEAAGVR
jgi:hypothetical protein